MARIRSPARLPILTPLSLLLPLLLACLALTARAHTTAVSDATEWVAITRTPLPHHELRHSLVRYYKAGGRHLYVLRGDRDQIHQYVSDSAEQPILSPNFPVYAQVFTGSANRTVDAHMTAARQEVAAADPGLAAYQPLRYPQHPHAPRDLDCFAPVEHQPPKLTDRFGTPLATRTLHADAETCRTNSNIDGRIGYSPGAFSWGIDRVDQDHQMLDYNFCSGYDGSGTHIYILDTGVAEHTTFGGRVEQDWSWYTADMRGNGDQNGHGTHVAGLAASGIYGVATGATIHNVQVLSASGSGTFAGVAAGLLYVYENGTVPGVVNLSLGAQDVYLDAVAQLIQQLYDDRGIISVASAGNGATSACDAFPASVPTAFTVASTTVDDRLSGFSNFGTCVDVLAPGSEIISCIGDGVAATPLSGTSMAAPVVSGLIALVQEKIMTETSAVAALYEQRGASAAYHAYYGTRAYNEYQRLLHSGFGGLSVSPNPRDVLNMLLHDADYSPVGNLPPGTGTPNIMPLTVRTEPVELPVPDPPPIPSGAPSSTSKSVSERLHEVLLYTVPAVFFLSVS